MEISFCYHPNNNIVIATIFGTWHDSWAVVACAKFCCDVIISNWIRVKWNFHHIWIVMEKLLVKWAPGLYFHGNMIMQTRIIMARYVRAMRWWFRFCNIKILYIIIQFMHVTICCPSKIMQYLSSASGMRKGHEKCPSLSIHISVCLFLHPWCFCV